jgi:hypothetical protein
MPPRRDVVTARADEHAHLHLASGVVHRGLRQGRYSRGWRRTLAEASDAPADLQTTRDPWPMRLKRSLVWDIWALRSEDAPAPDIHTDEFNDN